MCVCATAIWISQSTSYLTGGKNRIDAMRWKWKNNLPHIGGLRSRCGFPHIEHWYQIDYANQEYFSRNCFYLFASLTSFSSISNIFKDIMKSFKDFYFTYYATIPELKLKDWAWMCGGEKEASEWYDKSTASTYTFWIHYQGAKMVAAAIW
jgi:hypothetical protein